MNSIDQAIQQQTEMIADASLVIQALARIKSVPGVDVSMAWRRWVFGGGPRPVAIYLSLTEGASSRDAIKALLRATGIKRASKKFNEAKGAVVYTLESDEFEVELTAGAPERCEVERIEETIEVPEEINPAHQETRVVYRLKDPACLEGKVREVKPSESIGAPAETEVSA